MRNNSDLQLLLDGFLAEEFSDMERSNEIVIAFGRRAKRRLGSIRMTRGGEVSQITINGIFKDENIPEQIIRAVLAHELCHYAHGFCSPLKQKYKHPHQGGVIRREMKKRGLDLLYQFEKTWTKKRWPQILMREFPQQIFRLSGRGRRGLPQAKGLLSRLFQ